MSKAKHTPGPWEYGHYDAYRISAKFDGGGICILNREGEELTANARLIASAPKLLKALKQVEADYVYNGMNDGPSWDTIRSAISDAEGGENE